MIKINELELLEPITVLRDVSAALPHDLIQKTKEVASLYFENGLPGFSEVLFKTLDG